MMEHDCVFKRLGHLLLILALLSVTGSHWAMLQSIAWTTMLVDNLQSYPLGEAVQRTFDGEHPCKLCCEIKAGKKSEKKTQLAPVTRKLEFVSNRPVFIFSAPRTIDRHFDFQTLPQSVGHQPAVPPPRFFNA